MRSARRQETEPLTALSGLAALGVDEGGALLRSGALRASELAEGLLERVRVHDREVNAFLRIDEEDVMRQARAAEDEIARGQWRGPLHGIPVAVKDNIDVGGVRTTCHSALRADTAPARDDAPVVARLRQAGAVILGKTALHEFALGGPTEALPWPAARNPWSTALHPGGSSSGSGAALAAGFVPAALGTDTSGSVRNPATCCGIVGLKPSYDLLSREGVFPLAFSLDHVGPMARSALDCGLLLDAMLPPGHPQAGAGERGARAGLREGMRGLRIGVVEHFHREEETCDARVAAGFDTALRTLQALGGRMALVRLAPLALWNACCRVIQQVEQYAVHERWLRERPEDYCEIGRAKLLVGAFLPRRDYLRALQARGELCRQFRETMRDFDVLVLPSSLELPCALDDAQAIASTYERHLRAPFSVTGTPAIAVPVGRTAEGLPLGIQIAGRAHDEAGVLRVAAALGAAIGH